MPLAGEMVLPGGVEEKMLKDGSEARRPPRFRRSSGVIAAFGPGSGGMNPSFPQI